MKSIYYIVIALSALFLYGCTDSEETSFFPDTSVSYEPYINDTHNENEENFTETSAPKITSPEYGGTLKMSMRIPQTLNPLVNEDITVDKVLKIIFEPLFKKDTSGKVVSNIAESYAFANDVLTIKIKSGLKWHDGTAITAKDVIFSLDTIKAQGDKCLYKDALKNISSYTESGDTITIKLSSPYYYSIYNLCFPIIPASYYAGKTDLKSDVSMKPLGNGCFKFSSYRLANELILEKCEGINGSPYIDKISVITTDDRQTDLYAFEQAVTDVIQSDISEWGKYSAGKKINMTEYNTNNFEFLGYNFKKPLLAEISVRQAISQAVPSDEITKNVYLNHGITSRIPINPNMWFYSEDAVSRQYSIKNAAGIIEKTGYTKDKLKLSILVNEENKSRCEAASIIADKLNQIGFDVSVDKQPFDVYQNRLKSDNFDLFIGGVKLSNLGELKPFLSSQAMSSGINVCNYSSTQMDALLAKTETAAGDDNFKSAYEELQKFIDREIPCTGICFKYSALLTSENVNGEKTPTIDNIYNDIHKWYINQ